MPSYPIKEEVEGPGAVTNRTRTGCELETTTCIRAVFTKRSPDPCFSTLLPSRESRLCCPVVLSIKGASASFTVSGDVVAVLFRSSFAGALSVWPIKGEDEAPPRCFFSEYLCELCQLRDQPVGSLTCKGCRGGTAASLACGGAGADHQQKHNLQHHTTNHQQAFLFTSLTPPRRARAIVGRASVGASGELEQQQPPPQPSWHRASSVQRCKNAHQVRAKVRHRNANANSLERGRPAGWAAWDPLLELAVAVLLPLANKSCTSAAIGRRAAVAAAARLSYPLLRPPPPER